MKTSAAGRKRAASADGAKNGPDGGAAPKRPRVAGEFRPLREIGLRKDSRIEVQWELDASKARVWFEARVESLLAGGRVRLLYGAQHGFSAQAAECGFLSEDKLSDLTNGNELKWRHVKGAAPKKATPQKKGAERASAAPARAAASAPLLPEPITAELNAELEASFEQEGLDDFLGVVRFRRLAAELDDQAKAMGFPPLGDRN